MKRIRVMIVEDSAVVREILKHLIGADPRLEVACAVGSAEEALRELSRIAPDVISMDIRLPGMNGFEATQQIMTQRPTPIVVISASVEAEDLKVSMNALRAGALAVYEKPVGLRHQDFEAMASRICNGLVNMSHVKVIRQRIDRGLRFGAAASAPPLPSLVGPFQLVAMVASTGGPNAWSKVLAALPASFPLPILLVQHITPAFHEGFVTWLDGLTPLKVRVARDAETPQPGNVYVAPGDQHLRLIGGRLRLDSGEPVCLQRPSGTILFESIAQALGSAAIGVLLTGMGEDGATGLRSMRVSGGYTLAEDESTSVVYGMPAAAVRLGGVCESLPLEAIAPRVLELVAKDGRP